MPASSVPELIIKHLMLTLDGLTDEALVFKLCVGVSP